MSYAKTSLDLRRALYAAWIPCDVCKVQNPAAQVREHGDRFLCRKCAKQDGGR